MLNQRRQVLFLGFHVGEGPLRVSAAGISRLTWVSLHRIPAIIAVTSLIERRSCPIRAAR